jgi:hypothetical protein
MTNFERYTWCVVNGFTSGAAPLRRRQSCKQVDKAIPKAYSSVDN